MGGAATGRPRDGRAGPVLGPRRDPGLRRPGGALLPLRGVLGRRRAARGRCVLRAVRLPHHHPLVPGAGPERHHPARDGSGPNGPAASCPPCSSVLVGVAVYAHFDAGSLDLSSIRGDAVATLLYVANWHFILSDQGYFAQAAAPSPFLHTWSLAVEEQYYLFWPLIALFVVRRWGIPKLAVTAAVGAVASAALMVSLYAAGFSVDRLYYGTDTRAQALLVGSFLGAVGSHGSDRFAILPDRWTDTLPPAPALGGARPGGCGVPGLGVARAERAGRRALPGRVPGCGGGGRGGHPQLRHRAVVAAPPGAVGRAAGVRRPHLLRAVPLPLAAVPGHRPCPHRTERGRDCSPPGWRPPSPSPPPPSSGWRSPSGPGACSAAAGAWRCWRWRCW